MVLTDNQKDLLNTLARRRKRGWPINALVDQRYGTSKGYKQFRARKAALMKMMNPMFSKGLVDENMDRIFLTEKGDNALGA